MHHLVELLLVENAVVVRVEPLDDLLALGLVERAWVRRLQEVVELVKIDVAALVAVELAVELADVLLDSSEGVIVNVLLYFALEFVRVADEFDELAQIETLAAVTIESQEEVLQALRREGTVYFALVFVLSIITLLNFGEVSDKLL